MVTATHLREQEIVFAMKVLQEIFVIMMIDINYNNFLTSVMVFIGLIIHVHIQTLELMHLVPLPWVVQRRIATAI